MNELNWFWRRNFFAICIFDSAHLGANGPVDNHCEQQTLFFIQIDFSIICREPWKSSLKLDNSLHPIFNFRKVTCAVELLSLFSHATVLFEIENSLVSLEENRSSQFPEFPRSLLVTIVRRISKNNRFRDYFYPSEFCFLSRFSNWIWHCLSFHWK